jgi:hypothetical protein
MNNAKIGAAVMGGYLLGRTKKAKLAIGLGALLAGSRIKPGQVGKALQESPFVHTLTDQVRTELTDAGKAAATSVMTAKADSLADALHERTAGLREKAHGQERGPEAEEAGEAEQTEQTEEAEAPEGEAEAGSAEEGPVEDQPRKKKAAASQSRSRSSGAARSRRRSDG